MRALVKDTFAAVRCAPRQLARRMNLWVLEQHPYHRTDSNTLVCVGSHWGSPPAWPCSVWLSAMATLEVR